MDFDCVAYVVDRGLFDAFEFAESRLYLPRWDRYIEPKVG